MQVQTREDPGSNGRGWTALRERRAGTANLRVGTRDPRRQARPFLPSTRGAKMPALRKSHHSAENRGNTWERHRSGTCARAPRAKNHRQGDSNCRAVVPGLCSWKSAVRVSAGLVPSKGSEGEVFWVLPLSAGCFWCLLPIFLISWFVAASTRPQPSSSHGILCVCPNFSFL